MSVQPVVVLLLSLSLAACVAGLGGGDVARWTALEHRAAEAERYADPANRVAADSGIVFEFGSCIRYTFYSPRDLLVRDQGFTVDPERPRGVIERVDSVRVALTAAEAQAIFAEADRIDLWSYPTTFDDSLTIDAERAAERGYSAVMPYSRFRVDLRDGDRSTVVRWSDEVTAPLTPEAERLRAFGRRVESMLREKAEAGGLSPPSVFCL